MDIADGPWVSKAYVRAEKWGVVARIGLSYSLQHWDVPQRANARLISAAPDLLTQLQYLRDCIESGHEPAMSAVNAAIAKATGVQP